MKYLGGWKTYGLRSLWGVLLTEIIFCGQSIPELVEISWNNLCSLPQPGIGLGDTSRVSDTLPHHASVF